METPLKGKGGALVDGWQSWRTNPGIHYNQPRDGRSRSLFSPGGPQASESGSEAGFAAEGDGGLSPPAQPQPAPPPPLPPPLPPPPLPLPLQAAAAAAASSPPPPPAPLGMLEFLQRELHWGHALSWRERGAPTEHVMNFLRVTLSLEPFLTFGHLLCIDLFIFHFTLLPLRCLAALARLAGLAAASLLAAVLPRTPAAARAPAFTQAQVYDLIKGAIFVAATLALGAVQVSRVYHYIRGEAIIKLCVACARARARTKRLLFLP
jgi:hypothetical protein